jgi:hypothetical protein
MNTININGVELTLGLMWTRIGGENPRKEIIEVSNKLTSPFGVVRKSIDKTHIGLTDEEKANKTFSAAALVAEIATDCVLVEKVGDDRYWICCVMGGEVIPGSDEVSNSDRMSSMVEEFSNLPSFDGEKILIYASEDVCHEIGITADYNLSLADILEEFGDYKSKLTLAKIVRLNSKVKSVLIGLGVVAVVGGGLGVNYWLDMREKARELEAYNLMLAQKAANNTNEVVITVEMILAKAYDEEMVFIDKEFNEQSLHYVLPTYIDLVKSRIRSSNIGGWKIHQAELRLGTTGEPVVTGGWENIGDGDYQSLISVIDADFHKISGDGQNAFTNYKFKKNDVIFDNHYESFIKNAKNIRSELIDELLDLNVIFKLGDREKTLRFERISGLPKGDMRADEKVAHYTAREFSIKGNGLSLIEAVNETLSNEKYSHMILNKVLTNISSGNDFSWALTGVIYEN